MAGLIGIIEDEEDLLELLEYNLQKEGFEILGFLTTKKVEQFIKEENVDLLIVDRNLPGVEGSEFVREIRAKGFQVPVLYLSAKSTNKEKLDGFDSGADDYLTKPFVMEELVYRVKAILKRTKQDEVDILQFRDIIIKQKSKEVIIDDRKIDLTKLEFNLLTEFIKNKNIVLTREYLLENVWGGDSIYQDRTVNVAIKRLKEKIDGSREKNYIKSIRGEGYTLC
ncbi:MAG: response regulator transcription factor [Campylobacterales bacterium]